MDLNKYLKWWHHKFKCFFLTSILPLSQGENPWWPISMACSLPQYTSRLETIQKLLFTIWFVPLKPNVTTYSLKYISVWVITEYWLLIAAVGMRNVEFIGAIAVLHPDWVRYHNYHKITIYIYIKMSYHRRALRPIHTAFHWLNS